MFKHNEDKSIFVTRGDNFDIPVEYAFQKGDVVRFKATKKKDCNAVVIQREILVDAETDAVTFHLTALIGEVISKPVDYWYEVELNPDTNPKTIIGYDEDGPKILRLFPEGGDVNAEDIEVVGKKTLQDLVDTALEQAKARYPNSQRKAHYEFIRLWEAGCKKEVARLLAQPSGEICKHIS